MATAVLINLGSRDLRVDGSILEKQAYRAQCERILDELKQRGTDYRGRIAAPMVETVLDYVLSETGQVPAIFLFVTNQADERYRQSDTIASAEVIKHYLNNEWKQSKGVNEKMYVRIVELSRSPAHYDEMYTNYGERIEELKPKLLSYERCYVSATGGTPACGFGILTQSIRLLGRLTYPLYVPEGSHKAEPLSITDQLLRDDRLAKAREMIGAGMFGAAARLLEEARAGRDVVAVAMYAEHRLNFDFARAEGSLWGVWDVLDSRGLLRKLIDDLPSSSRDNRAVLRDIFFSAQVLWEMERYSEFLSRAVRFVEASCRQIVSDYLGLAIQVNPQESRQQFDCCRRANRYLQDYIDKQTVDNQQLDCRRWPDIPVMLVVVDFLAGDGRKSDGSKIETGGIDLRAVLDGLLRLDLLRGMRNKWVHASRGISAGDILDEYDTARDNSNPLDEIRGVVQHLRLDTSFNPYEDARKFILEHK